MHTSITDSISIRYYKCEPLSSPELPPTHHHPMWDAWDLAAESCLSQLPAMISASDEAPYEYRHSTFFAEQLTAFEVWLRKGGISSLSFILAQQYPNLHPSNYLSSSRFS